MTLAQSFITFDYWIGSAIEYTFVNVIYYNAALVIDCYICYCIYYDNSCCNYAAFEYAIGCLLSYKINYTTVFDIDYASLTLKAQTILTFSNLPRDHGSHDPNILFMSLDMTLTIPIALCLAMIQY